MEVPLEHPAHGLRYRWSRVCSVCLTGTPLLRASDESPSLSQVEPARAWFSSSGGLLFSVCQTGTPHLQAVAAVQEKALRVSVFH